MSGSEVTVSQTQSLSFKVSKVAQILETTGEVTITAINTAISAAVNLVELIKHRVKGLHQQNLFEKVPNSNKTRVVFKLSLKALQNTDKGYQAPIPEGEVKEKSFAELKKLPWEDKKKEEKHEEKKDEKKPEEKGKDLEKDHEKHEETRRGQRGRRFRRWNPRRGRESRGEEKDEYKAEERGSARGRRFRRGDRGHRRGNRGERGVRGERGDRRPRSRRPRGERRGRGETSTGN